MDHPDYALQLQWRPQYLYARIAGPSDTVETSLAYWTELAGICGQHGVRRLLVEEVIEGHAAPGDIDVVVNALLGLGFRDIRIAYVDATEDAAALVDAEARVQESGLRGRVFRRVDEAERWLLRPEATEAKPPAV